MHLMFYTKNNTVLKYYVCTIKSSKHRAGLSEVVTYADNTVLRKSHDQIIIVCLKYIFRSKLTLSTTLSAHS